MASKPKMLLNPDTLLNTNESRVGLILGHLKIRFYFYKQASSVLYEIFFNVFKVTG
jgi:hypothetical protein